MEEGQNGGTLGRERERRSGGCIITFFTLPSPRGFFGWVSAGDSTLIFLAAGSPSSMASRACGNIRRRGKRAWRSCGAAGMIIATADREDEEVLANVGRTAHCEHVPLLYLLQHMQQRC